MSNPNLFQALVWLSFRILSSHKSAREKQSKMNIRPETEVIKRPMFIAGVWRGASDASQLDVIDPATETTIASVPHNPLNQKSFTQTHKKHTHTPW